MAYSSFAVCVVLVVVIALLSIAVVSVYERSGLGYVQRSHVWKPCYRSVHYGWLLALRIVGFVYCLGVLIYDIVLWGPFVFEYYTQWSFTLLIVYFGIAIGATIKEKVKTRSVETSASPDNRSSLLGGFPEPDEEKGGDVVVLDAPSELTYHRSEDAAGMDGYVMQIFYQIVIGSAVLTDVVYWTCIFPTYSFVDIVEVSMHAVNLVFLLGDLALNSMTFPWFRGAYFALWSTIFIFFTWIIHALGENEWPYPFLDVSLTLAPLWYFLLCLGHLVVYAFMCYITHLKGLFLKRCQAG